MKLSDLFERLASPVYVNDAKTLHLVNNLIQKEFGLKSYEGSGGMCFLSQFIFSIASATGIPEQTIADVFTKKTSGTIGHSLKDLLEFFGNVDIPHGKKIHRLKLSFEKYKNINDVTAAVKSGIPVTFITSSYHPLYNQLNSIDWKDQSKTHKGLVLGFSKHEPKDKKIEDYQPIFQIFHALLFVGYDSAYKMLIGRESRSAYGYKGYFRIYAKELKENFDQFAFLSIIVDAVETIDKPPPKKPEEKYKIGDKIKIDNARLFWSGDIGIIKTLLYQNEMELWGYDVKVGNQIEFMFANEIKGLV